MAYSFNGSNQYLYALLSSAYNVPLSCSAWLYPTQDANATVVSCLATNGDVDDHVLECENLPEDDLEAASYNGSTYTPASTSTSHGTNAWYHGLAVWATSSSRIIYLDGGGKGTDSTACATSNVDEVWIARRNVSSFGYFEGYLAEVAWWDATLDDDDALMLAEGVSPLLVKPHNLILYFPLIRDLNDRVGGYTLTAYNTPTVVAHPPMYYPVTYPVLWPAGAGSSPSASESASESASPSLSESASPSLSESASESASPSLSESASPSLSESASESVSPSLSESASESASESVSESASPSPGPTGEVCWGHVTGVIEANVRTFVGNWTGTGDIQGAGDAETICLAAGEEMISEMVYTDITTVLLGQNVYDPTGDDVQIQYRHGATAAACNAAAWNNYVAPFESLGFVQVKLLSTL